MEILSINKKITRWDDSLPSGRCRPSDKGEGWGGGHPDPEMWGGGGRSQQKKIFRPSGPQLGLTIRGGGPGSPGPSPGSATALWRILKSAEYTKNSKKTLKIAFPRIIAHIFWTHPNGMARNQSFDFPAGRSYFLMKMVSTPGFRKNLHGRRFQATSVFSLITYDIT